MSATCIADAFSRGELSFSKVRALTRVATPDNEPRLLTLARSSTASQLERAVRGLRRLQRNEEREQAERQHASRELRTWYDDDGSLVVRARLSPEQGALLLKALEAATDSLNPKHVPAGTPEADSAADSEAVDSAEDPIAARRADALARLGESFLATDAVALAGGERYQLMVHVDADSLPLDGTGLRSELEDGPGVPAETSRRVACDCSRVCVHEDATGNVLDIGRRTKHTLEFRDPRDRSLPAAPLHPVPPDTGALHLARHHQRQGLRITPLTPTPRWHGEPLHLGATVAWLAEEGATSHPPSAHDS